MHHFILSFFIIFKRLIFSCFLTIFIERGKSTQLNPMLELVLCSCKFIVFFFVFFFASENFNPIYILISTLYQ